jgi:hypothetical protein
LPAVNRRGLLALGKGALLAGVVGVACATSGAVPPGPPKCERGVCAKLIERTFGRMIVEVTAPAHASLHNAWLAGAGGRPCRGGDALNSVDDDAGVRTNGPLPLEGTERLKLAFAPLFPSVDVLDLDVRLPGGPVCLRLPLKAAPASDGGGG